MDTQTLAPDFSDAPLKDRDALCRYVEEHLFEKDVLNWVQGYVSDYVERMTTTLGIASMDLDLAPIPGEPDDYRPVVRSITLHTDSPMPSTSDLKRILASQLTSEDIYAYWRGEPTPSVERLLTDHGLSGFRATLQPIPDSEPPAHRPEIEALYRIDAALTPEALEDAVRNDPHLILDLGHWFEDTPVTPQHPALATIHAALDLLDLWHDSSEEAEARVALRIFRTIREQLDEAGMRLLTDWIAYRMNRTGGYAHKRIPAESDLEYLERHFQSFPIRFDILVHRDPDSIPGLRDLTECEDLNARQKAERVLEIQPRAAAFFEFEFHRGPHPDDPGRYYVRDVSGAGDYGYAVLDRETGASICSSKWARWCESMAETFNAHPHLVEEYQQLRDEHDRVRRAVPWQEADQRWRLAFRALGNSIREWRHGNETLNFYDPFERERTPITLLPPDPAIAGTALTRSDPDAEAPE